MGVCLGVQEDRNVPEENTLAVWLRVGGEGLIRNELGGCLLELGRGDDLGTIWRVWMGWVVGIVQESVFIVFWVIGLCLIDLCLIDQKINLLTQFNLYFWLNSSRIIIIIARRMIESSSFTGIFLEILVLLSFSEHEHRLPFFGDLFFSYISLSIFEIIYQFHQPDNIFFLQAFHSCEW